MAGTDDQSSKTISGVAGGSQGAPRGGRQPELATKLDGRSTLSRRGLQNSRGAIYAARRVASLNSGADALKSPAALKVI